MGQFAGLIEVALVFGTVIAFCLHQLHVVKKRDDD